MNYKMIVYILGSVLKVEAAFLLIPFLCAVAYGESEETVLLLLCTLLCFLAGMLLAPRRPKNKAMYAREGFVSVALSWIIISVFGALPFLFSGAIPSFADAFFETVSGFTTTGSSILTNVESMPKSLLMWRSLTHWIGGMGVLVFLMAVMPLSGGGNLHLLKAESPGPSVSKLVPKVGSTAKLLYVIYIALTVIEVLLLLAGGMSLFEALTTAFGTAGTGGFGVRNSSIAGYSPYIQYVVTVFMLLFGVDFSLYYMLLFRGARLIFRSDELKAYFGIVLTAIVLIFLNCRHLFAGTEEALRSIAFTVSSIITTTGFATADFNTWPEFSKMILVVLMFVGACAGSTGGGIKVSRIVILLKSIVKEIRTNAHPRITLKLKMNGRLVEHETARGVSVFLSSYVVIFTIALLLISFDNFDFTTGFTAVAATMNNIGPGLGMVGPTGNFSQFSVLSKAVLSVCMLVGRLEIFPMLLLFSPSTWKK